MTSDELQEQLDRLDRQARLLRRLLIGIFLAAALALGIWFALLYARAGDRALSDLAPGVYIAAR